MSDILIELKDDLTDIGELIERAARVAYEASGDVAGREPIDCIIQEDCLDCGGTGLIRYYAENGSSLGDAMCSGCGGDGYWRHRHTDPGEPAVPGWPAMLELVGRLEAIKKQLDEAVPPEVLAAITEAETAEREAP